MNSDRKNDQSDPTTRDMNTNRLERNSSAPNDLPDSKRDSKSLKTEETFIDLPDVKDIPGQEFIHTLPPGSLADTTISSSDEEGTDVFDKEDEADLRRTGNEADVSRNERKTLEQIDYMPTTDENNLHEAQMDNVDFQNEPLNERGFGEGKSDETRTSSTEQDEEE